MAERTETRAGGDPTDPRGGPGDGDGRTAGDGAASGGSAHHPEIDWEAAERSPEFKELTRKRRSFVIPATGFFLAWYFGFIILAGYAPDFMGERIYEGFTVGYAFALSQFVMVWVLAGWYLRRANRDFDPLAKRAVERAVNGSEGDGKHRRFASGDGAEVTS
jgi:uncharacterized membrane protein (DUF485 family)